MKKIYIDGEHGTTGLELKQHLMPLHQKKLEILFSAEDKKKDIAYKKKMYRLADLVVLCLPDEAAKESVEIINQINKEEDRKERKKIKCLDTSSAHRVAKEWLYGFPEIVGGKKIQSAQFVTNPGCYATGFIAAVRPLLEEKKVNSEFCFCCKGISGYSGGGRQLINYYENENDKKNYNNSKQANLQAPVFSPYSLELNHKHIKEMKKHSLLQNSPLFLPSVVPTYRGMLVMVYLPLININKINNQRKKLNYSQVVETLQNYYCKSLLVKVNESRQQNLLEDKFLKFFEETESQKNNHLLEIIVTGNEENIVLISRLDNLGRGSATTALENILLMIAE